MNARQLKFAYKVRQALNENLDAVPDTAVARLASARRIALAHRKQPAGSRLRAWLPLPAPAGSPRSGMPHWLGAAAAALPVLVLAVGLAGIFQAEERRRIDRLAEIDAQMLADDLPLSAYLDNGFNTYLSKRGD